MLDQAAAMTADVLSPEAVNDMLGRPGRAESMSILKAAFDGDAAAALAGFARVHKNGAEAEMVAADLLNIVHQASLAAANASIDELNENERAGIAALGKLGIAKLGRAWQLLLKGHEEISRAPNPAAAFEMLMIRLAHTANMPTPSDILQKLPKAAHSPTPPSEGKPASSPSMSSNMAPGLSSGSAQPTMASQPQEEIAAPATQIDQETKPEASRDDTSLADIAALAEAQDEMLLAARIRTHLRLVSIQPGSLEVALTEKATT